MNFYNLQNAPVNRNDFVCKRSSFTSAIPVIVLYGIALAGLLGGLKIIHFGVPQVVCWIIAAFLGLFGLLFFAQFRATLKPTNWLLRIREPGVVIKFRSYLNRDLPATDTQVVQIDYSEIAWARKAVEHRTVRGADNRTELQRLVHIDFCLKEETTALAENLQNENARESGTSSHWEDYPVQLLPERIVRIHWNGTTPGVNAALKKLSRNVKIEPEQKIKNDFASVGKITPEELKEKVQTLVASGDTIAACELLRRAQRCSLTEAMQYVDKVKAERR